MNVYKVTDYYAATASRVELNIVDVLTNPITNIAKKEKIPMWGFYRGLNNNEYCSKKAESFSAYTAIVLDYDSGYTIEDCQAALRGIKHYGYTSYNHKPNAHRYRVILPLLSPLPFEIYGTTVGRSEMVEAFPKVDVSTFYKGRFFLHAM